MASPETKESACNNPGLHTIPDEETKGFFLQQTNFRVKDPKVSLDFYSRIMGMSLLKRLDFPDYKLTVYLLGYEDTSSAPSNPIERTNWTFGQKATLELAHEWGTENDPDFKGYHTGNSEPKGYGAVHPFVLCGPVNGLWLLIFLNMQRQELPGCAFQEMQVVFEACDGHIGITVHDINKACKRFERLNVEFVKRPDDGMKNIAFIKDPDGYWIEIFDTKTVGKATALAG